MLFVFLNSNVTDRFGDSLVGFGCGSCDRKVAKPEDSVFVRCLAIVWLFLRIRILASVGQCSAIDDLDALFKIR